MIDVVAAAERLSPSASQIVAVDPPLTGARTCPLGHENAAGVTFCGSCGIKVDDAQVAPARVDLAQARPEPPQTDEERARREREHVEAMAAAARFENAPQQYVPAEPGGVLIHFIEDGLTAFGKVWYRGEELEIGPTHPRWEEALRWITMDRTAQIDRYGVQKFAPGPWPGRRSYAEGSYEQLLTMDKKTRFAGPSQEQLREADEAARRRGRGVPAASFR